MDKLQFDSFYKFLVSLGMILIISPILFIYLLISNSFDLIYNQHDYDNLSTISKWFIDTKTEWIEKSIDIVPWIAGIVLLLGVVLVIIGCKNWYKNQKERDKKILLENEELENKIKQLTAEEVVEKMVQETDESTQGRDNTYKDRLIKGFRIENACFSYIQDKLGHRSYSLKQNVKVGREEYDFIATSRRDNIDQIYEIKYYDNTVSKGAFKHVYNRLLNAGINYEEIMLRNFRLNIIIVSKNEILQELKERIPQYMSEENMNLYVDFIDEHELI